MKLAIIAGALALAAASTAYATDPVNPSTSADSTATFQSLDTDGNGRISAEEARSHSELNSGYEGAVSDSEAGMSNAEFDTWSSSQRSSTTPPRN